MRSTVRASLACIAGLALLAGCQGADPSTLAIQGGLDQGFQAIRPDAELGIRLRSDPSPAFVAARQAAGITTISPGLAAFARETLDYHKALIDILKDHELGTVDPDAPLPPGPTAPP